MKLSGVIVLSVLCLLISGIVALEGPSTYFSKSNADSLKSFVLSQQQADGTFGSVDNTFYAVGILKSLKADVPKSAEIVKSTQAALSSANLAGTLSAIKTLQLLGASVPADAFTKATSLLAKVDELNLEDASLVALILSNQTPVNKKLATLVERISQFRDESDGSFKSEETDTATSFTNARLALSALASIPASALSSLETTKITDIASTTADLVSSGAEGENTLSYVDSNKSPVTTTGGLIVALNSLASTQAIVKNSISKEQIQQIAEFLASNKAYSTLEEGYYGLAGLNALSNGNLYVPVVLSVIDGSVAPGSKKTEFAFEVTDLLGNPIASKLFLTKAVSSIDLSKIVLRSQDISATNNVYKLNFLAAKPEAGFYTLELSATPTATGKSYIPITSTKQSVKVLTTIELNEAQLSLHDPGHDMPLKIKIDSESVSNVKFGLNKKLEFTFKLQGPQSGKLVRAQQVFVQLRNQENEYTYIAIANQKNYAVDIVLPSNAKSGHYELVLIVGDAFISNPLLKTLAKVEVAAKDDSVKPTSIYSAPLPEITHVFRAPEKRPSIFISQLFTGLVLAPLLFLLIGLVVVRANVSNFPTGLTFFAALAFHGGLLAILGLIFCFWLHLPFLETIKYLFFLGIFTFVVGHRVLLYVAEHTAKKTKKD